MQSNSSGKHLNQNNRKSTRSKKKLWRRMVIILEVIGEYS
jgi:hypothetical protein